ncbi:MAG: hypothetical protein NC300_04690 [Bacteroidales bacterium]|nr:hypothetical protein [Clostridium sp.]MCM1203418.1 hypothetical protein [Bacteroidales bacterium]
MKKNKNKQNDSFSNCHRQQKNQQSAQVSETNSDEDSANAKYTVQQDDRERRDGPGGN